MLKIFVSGSEGKEGDQFVFNFTSPTNARAEADNFKNTITSAINTLQNAPTAATPGAGPTAKGDANESGTTPTEHHAQAQGGKPEKPLWEDDGRLLADAMLQQSLLKSNTSLQRVFMELLATKSDSVSNAKFVAQFWSTRLPLLRAHAFERVQQRGAYNALSNLKMRIEEEKTKLSLSGERIGLIFNQHPLVKKAYDENVPRAMDETQFWQRFFRSKLFKKLRGERVTDADAPDNILDRYLHIDELSDQFYEDTHVPHFLDLAGNEMDNSQRRGNRPDIDMRPAPIEKVPIIRTLNALSEKIMAKVAPSDVAPLAPIGMREEEFDRQQLLLRDLREEKEIEKLPLNMRDYSGLFSNRKEDREQLQKPQESPSLLLQGVLSGLRKTFPGHNAKLSQIVSPDDDDSDEEMAEAPYSSEQKPQAVGSRASLVSATTEVFNAIRQRHTQEDEIKSGTAADNSSINTFGLSQAVFDRLMLTHATTTEFLHQFWQAFLSGETERAREVGALTESLDRAMERIQAVASDADKERNVEVDKLRAQSREMLARRKANGGTSSVNMAAMKNLEQNVGGGRKVVEQLLGATIKSLTRATHVYKAALEDAQSQQAQQT